jgi:hypothetical protein
MDQTVDCDPPASEVETISHIEESTEAPSFEAERSTSSFKGNDPPCIEDVDKRSRTIQLLQLIESFGEIGGDIVASVFDSCQNDIEKAVAKLSEMTESMGIERYVVLKPGSEGIQMVGIRSF